jgi:hypothetical protein
VADRNLIVRATTPAVPLHFHVFLKTMADNQDVKLSKRLWHALRPWEYQPILMAICQMQASSDQMETVKRLFAVIPPRLLLTATERLSPPDGRIRDRKIIMVERAILDKTRDGGARWRGEV